MSKLGRWREPNWHYDRDIDAPWPKKRILDLLRRGWKARRKGENARRKTVREFEKDFARRPDYYVKY